MTVEIVTEVALFPEKEYINGIFVAVMIARDTGPVNIVRYIWLW